MIKATVTFRNKDILSHAFMLLVYGRFRFSFRVLETAYEIHGEEPEIDQFVMIAAHLFPMVDKEF